MKKTLMVLAVLVILVIAIFFVRHKKEVPTNPYMVNFIVTQHFCAHPGVWCSDVFCKGIEDKKMSDCIQQCVDIINQHPRPNCSP